MAGRVMLAGYDHWKTTENYDGGFEAPPDDDGENEPMTQQLEASDATLLTRMEEIVALLTRASKLGFFIVLGPEQIRMLITILEAARLAKGRKS